MLAQSIAMAPCRMVVSSIIHMYRVRVENCHKFTDHLTIHSSGNDLSRTGNEVWKDGRNIGKRSDHECDVGLLSSTKIFQTNTRTPNIIFKGLPTSTFNLLDNVCFYHDALLEEAVLCTVHRVNCHVITCVRAFRSTQHITASRIRCDSRAGKPHMPRHQLVRKSVASPSLLPHFQTTTKTAVHMCNQTFLRCALRR